MYMGMFRYDNNYAADENVTMGTHKKIQKYILLSVLL